MNAALYGREADYVPRNLVIYNEQAGWHKRKKVEAVIAALKKRKLPYGFVALLMPAMRSYGRRKLAVKAWSC